MKSPVFLLRSDFHRAKTVNDPMAQYGSLITIDENGDPRSRMVTLRSIEAAKIALIINDQSPKAKQLIGNGKYELLIFWPTLMIQYRIQGGFEFENDSTVEEEWRTKSKQSQVVDVFHSLVAQQSSPIESHSSLLNEVGNLSNQMDLENLLLPVSVKRLVLTPNYIEQWIGSPTDRLHRRAEFRLKGVDWSQQLLVP